MSKYINAERLKTFVQARRDMHYNHYVKSGVGCIAEYKYDEDVELLDLITSLHQEQPSLPDNLDEAAEEYRQGEVDSGCDYIDDSDGDSLYHSACLADAFKAGAEWANRHLTIEDIEKIHTFLYAVKNNKQGAFTFTRLSDEQYKEVLRRFKAIKEESK